MIFKKADLQQNWMGYVNIDLSHVWVKNNLGYIDRKNYGSQVVLCIFRAISKLVRE